MVEGVEDRGTFRFFNVFATPPSSEHIRSAPFRAWMAPSELEEMARSSEVAVRSRVSGG